MNKKFTAKKSITLHAPVSKVWKAITDPSEIKKYFFGTNVVTSWEPGTPIFYRGEWDGKPYEDKGTVLKFEPEVELQHDYWSSFSNLADVPDNYQRITYRLKVKGNSTVLQLTQSRIPTLEMKIHSTQNWDMVLKALKQLVEQ